MKSINEVAEKHNTTYKTLYKLIVEGSIKAEKFGNVWNITDSDDQIKIALDKRPKQGHAGKYNLPHNK